MYYPFFLLIADIVLYDEIQDLLTEEKKRMILHERNKFIRWNRRYR